MRVKSLFSRLYETRKGMSMAACRFSPVLLSFLLLTSCGTVIYDYPAEWAKQTEPPSSQECPDVSGTYLKYGYVDFRVKGHDSSNNCLIDHLLAEGGVINPYTERPGESDPALLPLINSAACIEIARSTPEKIEITIWSSCHDDRFILRQDSLSAAEGDFSCDQNGLHLKTRRRYLTAIISNLYISEDRTLLKAKDGSLLINYVSRASGHHTVVPASSEYSYWIKWDACEWDVSEKATSQ